MARYIDLEELEKRIKKNIEHLTYDEKPLIEWCKDECIRQAYAMPPAEVVPKSEVERLQSEVERLKKGNEYILMQHRFQRRPSGDCWNDVIEKAKADVAREIFEDLQGLLIMRVGVTQAIAELKKKYTRRML